MPHAVSLGLEIALVVLVWFNFDGYILYDFEAVCFQAYTLHRVVGEQAHLVYAQVAEHLGTAAVVALVGLEAQVNVGIHGVVALCSCCPQSHRLLPRISPVAHDE